jgi:hypothetical protein
MKKKEIPHGIIDDLLINGIITEVHLGVRYSSPRKKKKRIRNTGDNRMYIDHRRLNVVTAKDKYPPPLVEDQLDCLGGVGKGGEFIKYFMAFDIFSGSYQVSVDKDTIGKTAFITPDAIYEFFEPLRTHNISLRVTTK